LEVTEPISGNLRFQSAEICGKNGTWRKRGLEDLESGNRKLFVVRGLCFVVKK